jgi:hypothetical protein
MFTEEEAEEQDVAEVEDDKAPKQQKKGSQGERAAKRPKTSE